MNADITKIIEDRELGFQRKFVTRIYHAHSNAHPTIAFFLVLYICNSNYYNSIRAVDNISKYRYIAILFVNVLHHMELPF